MNGPLNIANDWKRPRATTSVIIRRGIFALVAVLSIAALGVAALPLVASTQLVRNRIAIELSAWSGFRVAIASTPQIEMWPSFKAVLSGVTLYQWGDWDNPAVIEAERVEIDMSAIDALYGNVSFGEVKLVNPVMRLGASADEPIADLITSSGRIAQAVESVRELVEASPDNPPIERFPTTKLASLDIQNGRVVQMVDGKQSDLVTRIFGKVEWPALNEAGHVELSGSWRGEDVKVTLDSSSPLALFAGGVSNLTASWGSNPLHLGYAGQLRLGSGGMVRARVAGEAENVRRAIEWTGAKLAVGSALGAGLMSGDVQGDLRNLAVTNAQVQINAQRGAGALALALDGPRPKLSGALAFDQLELEPLVSAFTPVWSYDMPAAPGVRTPASLVDTDLTVNIGKTFVGESELDAAAGKIVIDDGAATFELVQARGFGGKLCGSLNMINEKDFPTLNVTVKGDEVNGKQLATAIGLDGLAPDAKGDVAATITGDGHALDRLLASANGSVTAHFGPGKIDGLDLPGLVSKAARNGFFPASDVAQGQLAIDSADLDATIEKGVGRLKNAIVRAGQQSISLSGIMPYAGRGIAVTGAINSLNKISLFNPFGREATFFVGGSWDAPFVTAALPSQLPPTERAPQ